MVHDDAACLKRDNLSPDAFVARSGWIEAQFSVSDLIKSLVALSSAMKQEQEQAIQDALCRGLIDSSDDEDEDLIESFYE